MRCIALVLALSSVCFAGEKKSVRIFITDRSGFQASAETNTGGKVSAVANATQNPEQIKTLNKACPDLIITTSRDKADFVLVWDTKTWQQTSWSGHQNEYTVYKDGDLVFSGAAHKMTNAAKDICTAVTK